MNTTFTAQLLSTDDGSLTLCHPHHGESYHSSQGALFESEELYIKRSGLREALSQAQPLGILDVGLGLGYNALATISCWQQAKNPPALHMLSLEIDGVLFAAFLSGAAAWQSCWPEAWRSWVRAVEQVGETRYTACFKHGHSATSLSWEINLADAGVFLQAKTADKAFNFVWQDAFSPQHNPELWSVSWFTSVAKHCANDAILMTYSVSRLVCENLSTAQWCWEKIPAAGKKRQWLLAKKNLALEFQTPLL